MKITFLLTWADAMGGMEHAVLTQAGHLARAGHDVEVLSVFKTRAEQFFVADEQVRVRFLVDQTTAVPRPLELSGYDDETCRMLAARASVLVRREWEPAFNRLSDLEVERALRGLDTDILVSTTPPLMALATTLAPPDVLTVHQEHRVSEQRGAPGEPLVRYSPRLDALVSLTERSTQWLAEVLGDAAPRLGTITNALPPGFRPGSSLTARVVVMAGRLTGEKQVDQAIAAFREVVVDHPDWTLRIFGDGPEEVRLRRLINGADLYDHVQLLGSSPNMAEEWAKAGIALHTARIEAFGLVIAEAQAAGLPVVAYDSPNGPASVITHGQDGFLVPPGDVTGLAEAMCKLIEDEELRRSFGAAASRASARYDIDRVMGEWEHVYRELLAERGDQARHDRKAHRVALWTARTGAGGFAVATPPPVRSLVEADARDHESRIHARHRALVRSGGELCRLDDDATPGDVTQANLDAVIDVLERRDIPYWLLRDDGFRYRVAVEAEHKDATVAALSETYADEAVYVETLRTGGAVSGATIAATLPELSQVVNATGLRVFRPVVNSSRTLRYGPAYGCDLEFWAETEEGDELRAGRRTLIGATVPKVALTPARLRVGERTYPTIEAFTHTLAGDVAFPVDVLYTWVDGSDEKWLARKNAALAARGLPPVDTSDGAARFRNRDELKYSLRSLDMYAPWVNHIWLVTDDQVPPWLDTGHPKITVVDHRTMFGDRGRLPTFNSSALETQFHHIDGLAEHFLYVNDDMFFGRPTTPLRFFQANGTARHFLSPTAIAPTPVSEDDDFYFSAAKNNRTIIEKSFGRTITQTFLHTPYPLRRSVLAEIEERFADEVARTAESQFRSHSDITMAAALSNYYGFFTERSAPGSISMSYVNTAESAEYHKLTRLLTARPHDVFCLNDTPYGDVTAEEQAATVFAFLEAYFPVASGFEMGSARWETRAHERASGYR